jgi:hypothetical protein
MQGTQLLIVQPVVWSLYKIHYPGLLIVYILIYMTLKSMDY